MRPALLIRYLKFFGSMKLKPMREAKIPVTRKAEALATAKVRATAKHLAIAKALVIAKAAGTHAIVEAAGISA